MQRLAGNRAVSRSLADESQRDPSAAGPPAPATGGPAQSAPGTNPAGGMDPGWAPFNKLISEQLGEEKIKEHAKTLAGKGSTPDGTGERRHIRVHVSRSRRSG